MSVSPLSRGPRTITEGDVLAIAAALAPTIAELTATRADLEDLVASTVRSARRALSVDEFAAAWGVSASTVRRALDERRIPAMRLTDGGSIRIPADATPPVD